MKVLIVEDEPAYVDALRIALDAEGIDSKAALDGRDAIQEFRAGVYDVVLLDLMLPSVSGLDVLRAIRKDSTTPVVVVSAKDAESDVVTALELGADDYLTKPYSARELIARVRAVARRASAVTVPDTITVGNVSLDSDRYQLIVDGTSFDLPRKEFEEVWGLGWGDTKSLDQHIRRLRRKLEESDDTPRIVTIRGVGYRLEEV